MVANRVSVCVIIKYLGMVKQLIENNPLTQTCHSSIMVFITKCETYPSVLWTGSFTGRYQTVVAASSFYKLSISLLLNLSPL